LRIQTRGLDSSIHRRSSACSQHPPCQCASATGWPTMTFSALAREMATLNRRRLEP